MTMNVLNNDLTLKDLLDLLKRDIMLTMNCHALATVQSFDAVKQTLVAKINYARSYVEKKADGTTGTVLVNYPVLLDVPVVVFQGGPGAITMPIAAGDACLILFNDRDIDAWIHSGQGGQPNATNRLHSFADGLALVGLNPANDVLKNYDASRTVLRYDNGGGVLTQIALGSQVQISNSLANFGVFMDAFFTSLSGSADPTVAAAGAAAKIQFDLLFKVIP